MSLLCRIFGHKPPVYAKTDWFSPGEQYAIKIQRGATDGTGRVHAKVIVECARCQKHFTVCRIHLPKNKLDKC